MSTNARIMLMPNRCSLNGNTTCVALMLTVMQILWTFCSTFWIFSFPPCNRCYLYPVAYACGEKGREHHSKVWLSRRGWMRCISHRLCSICKLQPASSPMNGRRQVHRVKCFSFDPHHVHGLLHKVRSSCWPVRVLIAERHELKEFHSAHI